MGTILKIILFILGLVLLLPLAFSLFIRFAVWRLKRNHPELLEESEICEVENDPELEEERGLLQRLVVYRSLNEAVRDGMDIDQLIDAFRQMCTIEVGEPDDLLFETGTFSFSGEKRFYFSLVRQFRFLDPDEFVQLHLEIRYPPSIGTALLRGIHWGSPGDGDFFDHVKNSPAYRAVKKLPVGQVQVWVDET